MPLTIGDSAPDFTLTDQFGQQVSLSDFRGNKAVLILFYPFAFSGVCTGEMGELRQRLAEFVTFDHEVLGISCDPVYALRVFADRDGINLPLLSDFWPHGEATRSYDVFDERRGCPRRSSFVVDAEGRLTWAVHQPTSQGRNLDEHLRQLRAAVAD
ncbi:peroxiredoxin [Nocardioides limicola]|uniref:peroxiredoxin n=1 Tax=Nocardioides limicola TaxID=2803368 RepID=UPI00193BE32D|nr:peroxiredoxin [Nocardioides sp. DJM-14]